MALIEIITADRLKSKFEDYNRDDYSLEACEEIINDFQEVDENIELDIIAICCDYIELTEQEFYEENKEMVSNRYETLEEVEERIRELTFLRKLENGNYLYIVY